ncbi:MAG: helix-turn-helix domain-containing protein [Gaiellaceae bacterium]
MFEIGNSLREARLRHGYDLVDAEQTTKIRSKYLRALEDERFELLPAQTYVKGFLRSYAEYLGLDGQLYVDEYNSRYVTGEEEAPLRPRRSPHSTAHRRVESSVLLVALAGIAAVTALVIVAWKWGGSEPTQIVGVQPGPVVRPPAAVSPPAAPVTPASRWIALRLSAPHGNSTVAVYRGSATGKLLYEGTLEQGRPALQFTGKRLWLLISEPGNLAARINGRSVRLPGDGSAPIVAVASARGIAAAPPA